MQPTHKPLRTLPEFPEVTPEAARPSCANTLAVIMATDMRTTPVKVVRPDEDPAAVDARVKTASDNPLPRPLQLLDDRPLVAHVIDNVAPVFPKTAILAREGVDELRAAMDACTAEAASEVAIVEVDYARELGITAAGAGFDLMTLTKGRLTSILEELRAAAGPGNGGTAASAPFDSVCVFAADQPLITPRHIATLMEELRDSACEVAASWIEWRRVLPVALSSSCLERLCAQDFPGTRPGGQPALADIDLHDVCFGEEKLNGYLVLPEDNDQWLAGIDLPLPQALALARSCRQLIDAGVLPADCLAQDFDPGTLAEDAQAAFARFAPHRDAFGQIAYAMDTLETIKNATSGGEFAERDRWNSWAARNRIDFPLLNAAEYRDTFVYLDSAATAQRPDSVIRAQTEHESHRNANIWRGYYKLANDCTKSYETARARVAAFIGAKPGELIFTQNTTGALNLIAQSWASTQIAEGDLILCGIAEHHSNMLPWMRLRETRGAQVEFIPYTPDGRYDLDAYAQLLARGPKLVSFALIGNTIGIMAPAREMIQMAHDAGAHVAVDAAQALAHVRIDVHELGCDWLAFSSHKAYGPLALGGLFATQEALDEMDPVTLGGGTVSNVTERDYYLRCAPTSFEAGTPPITQAVGLAAACDYLDRLGMDAVHEHARLLCRYAIAALTAIPGVTVMGDHTQDDGARGAVSFHVANINCLNVSKSLGELGIAVRGGAHCAMPLAARLGTVGSLRVSVGVYNTFDDIDALVLGLRYVIDHFAGVEPRP